MCDPLTVSTGSPYGLACNRVWGWGGMAGHQEAGSRGVPVTKAALAELMAQLRQAAVGGVAPEAVFFAQTRKLGLREHERERLRDELVRLHVPVQRSVAHTD